MKTVSEVLAAFEIAAFNAGLARNTRKTYAGTILEFATMLKAGKIAGPQDYFNHLASVKSHTSLETTELYLHTTGGKTVRSPLDTAAERNIIPIRKLA